MKKSLSLLSVCFLAGISASFAQDSFITDGVLKSVNVNDLGIRFVINMIAILILVRVIYFTRHKNKDFLFTYILFNSINFLICFLLSGANLGVGFAFGLFAIFSIMRYRTVTLPVKEMGYLFLCVALGLLNSLAPAEDGYIILIAANAFILLLALVLDRTTTITYPHDESKQIEKNSKKIEKIMEQLKNNTPQMLPAAQQSAPKANPNESNVQQIIYERIDLIKPELRHKMIQDLRERTGLAVYAVDIQKIDLMHDVAEINVHFHEGKVMLNNGISFAQNMLNPNP